MAGNTPFRLGLYPLFPKTLLELSRFFALELEYQSGVFWRLSQRIPIDEKGVFAQYCQVRVVAVAQVVRAPDCGSGCRGFESRQPPHFFCPHWL